MGEVVGFPGCSVPDAPADLQPIDEIIGCLKELLSEAIEGRVRGVAIAVTRPDATTAQWWCGDCRNQLVASVAYLMALMSRDAIADPDVAVADDPA